MNKQLLQAYVEVLREYQDVQRGFYKLSGTYEGTAAMGRMFGLETALSALASQAGRHDLKAMAEMRQQAGRGEDPTFELVTMDEIKEASQFDHD